MTAPRAPTTIFACCAEALTELSAPWSWTTLAAGAFRGPHSLVVGPHHSVCLTRSQRLAGNAQTGRASVLDKKSRPTGPVADFAVQMAFVATALPEDLRRSARDIPPRPDPLYRRSRGADRSLS
jgi:hypothetical protein